VNSPTIIATVIISYLKYLLNNYFNYFTCETNRK
jgi:hypothetical protein